MLRWNLYSDIIFWRYTSGSLMWWTGDDGCSWIANVVRCVTMVEFFSWRTIRTDCWLSCSSRGCSPSRRAGCSTLLLHFWTYPCRSSPFQHLLVSRQLFWLGMMYRPEKIPHAATTACGESTVRPWRAWGGGTGYWKNFREEGILKAFKVHRFPI